MNKNIFLDIAQDLEMRATKIADKVARRFKKKEEVEDPYWKSLTIAANDMSALMLDERYPAMRYLVTELTKKLSIQIDSILTGDIANYSREKRADLAAIPAAQSQLLRYLMESPEKAVQLVRDTVEPVGEDE
ncbi:MAG: hypothetical protein ABSE82_07395 [Nitrososphaerales archaeon]|jgi:hypothetical protein